MKLQFGTNFRALRRQRELTQEELAELLGVSTQSVSRWETGVCYPDLELLPCIASFFETTVDQLLGVDRALEAQRAEEYLDRFQAAISVGDIEGCIAIAREGVQALPGNFQLMNKLMYALFVASDENGNIPDWRENRTRYDGEIVALGERIMRFCPDQDLRLEATYRLGFHHCEMGRRSQGRAILESLPSMEYCKELRIWWGLEDEEKLPWTRKLIHRACNALGAGMYNMIEGRLLPDRELVTVYHKIFQLDRLVYDGDYPYSGHLRCGLAGVYARLGEEDAALEQLRLAAEETLAFDRRPDQWQDESLLMGLKTYRRTDYETADSRPLRLVMAEKWMAAPDFDGLRETPEFQEVLTRLLEP